jgi:hypothetical protein
MATQATDRTAEFALNQAKTLEESLVEQQVKLGELERELYAQRLHIRNTEEAIARLRGTAGQLTSPTTGMNLYVPPGQLCVNSHALDKCNY